MQVRAYENEVYVVFAHPRQSLIIDRNGQLLAQCKRDSIVVRELSLAGLKKTRRSVTNRRPKTYKTLLKKSRN